MSRSRPRTSRSSEPPGGSARLQKILAEAGVASRRRAELLIREGRVSVNGKTVTVLGTRADPGRDEIRVDGSRVGRPGRRVYYLVHKPRGYVTTTRDPHARHTVMDLVRSRVRLFPVGRLDAASEGLLLLTNDGALAQVLLHPKFEIPRTYHVSVDGSVRADSLRRLAAGMELDGRRTAPCTARLLEREAKRSVVEIELIEGRRRQIRLLMARLGHPVRRLVRTRYGPLSLRGLASGDCRLLRAAEVAALERLARSAGNRNRQRRAQVSDSKAQ